MKVELIISQTNRSLGRQAERTKMAMQEELAKKRTVDRQSEADLKQAVLNAEKGAQHTATHLTRSPRC